MRTKLLKKLRKRYVWYFNTNLFPVLIDHNKQKVLVYDVEYLCRRFNYKVEDLSTLITVEHQEWALRVMKLDILSEYGWSMSHVIYKMALRKLKKKEGK